jgi:ERCC4-type nuclease
VSEPERLLEDATVAELSALGTLFELRHLKVSDFVWVCRERETGRELVLPYIVERKRMDDLAKSIQDGRFHEQKVKHMFLYQGTNMILVPADIMCGNDTGNASLSGQVS